ncbi:MAG: MotA/TolQ/ExbB proton channel family protein [Luteolibacter sp.]
MSRSLPKLVLASAAVVFLIVSFSMLQAQEEAENPRPVAVVKDADEADAEPMWLEKLRAGGWVTVVQIGLSVLGGGYMIGSVLRFRKSKIAPSGLVERADALWKAGKFEELEKLGGKDGSTLGRIVSFIAAEREGTLEDLTTTSGDMAARELARASQGAYPLAIVATLEPLLGLLGTVIGMIESFDTVALAGSLGDASLLAGGISKALVTTAVGLIISIPFLGMYHHFRMKADYFTTLLEEDLSNLLRHWFVTGKATKGGRV